MTQVFNTAQEARQWMVAHPMREVANDYSNYRWNNTTVTFEVFTDEGTWVETFIGEFLNGYTVIDPEPTPDDVMTKALKVLGYANYDEYAAALHARPKLDEILAQEAGDWEDWEEVRDTYHYKHDCGFSGGNILTPELKLKHILTHASAVKIAWPEWSTFSDGLYNIPFSTIAELDIFHALQIGAKVYMKRRGGV